MRMFWLILLGVTMGVTLPQLGGPGGKSEPPPDSTYIPVKGRRMVPTTVRGGQKPDDGCTCRPGGMRCGGPPPAP